jgi:hypothetical protein
MDSDGFPLRSFWSTPPGAQRLRQAVSPGKVSLLGFQWVRALPQGEPGCVTRKAADHLQWVHSKLSSAPSADSPSPPLAPRHHAAAQMCALLVFVCVSSQRAGLWGPSPSACALCNGAGPSGPCTTGRGGPHGLGCPYTAFGQFQCVATPACGAGGGPLPAGRCLGPPFRSRSRLGPSPHPAHRFLCAVGIMWWIATATLLLFACGGRNPPLMTVRASAQSPSRTGCCMCRLTHRHAPLSLSRSSSSTSLPVCSRSWHWPPPSPCAPASPCSGASPSAPAPAPPRWPACVPPHPPGDENELTDPTFPIPQHPPSGLRPSCGPPSC